MGDFVAPGVYTNEVDFSLYAQALATSIFGIVTTASKGPLNEVTLITDVNGLVSTFGPPSYPHYGLYAGERYLRRGSQLKVVRVGTYSAYATCPVLKDSTAVTDALTVSALTQGSWSGNISIAIANGYVSGTYKLIVLYNGAVVESFDRLLVGTVNASNVNFIETRINGISSYISVVSGTPTTLQLHSTPVAFTGGDDGAPADAGDVVGVVGSPPSIPQSGLQCFLKADTVDVNLLAVPGRSEADIVTSLITLCETRHDCLGIIDPPDMLSVQQVGEWHNGLLGGSDLATALVSNYAALYYPWLQTFDSWNNQNLWVPPSGHVAQAIAYNDFVGEPWTAPAGLNRGRLTDVIATRNAYMDQGDEEYLYGGGNAVNPILNKAKQGVTIWGQRTLQRAPTALDRINVRRLLLYLRKIVANSALYLVDEPDEQLTWMRFTDLVEPILRDVQSRRGVIDYKVICDGTTNTPYYMDRNEMRAKILIKPTKAAEVISIDFTLLPTGVDFTPFA